MKCENCKFRRNLGNTKETGKALCIYPASHFITDITDDCHILPVKKELTCQDCVNYYEDPGCIGCLPDESAYINGELCIQYRDKKMDDLEEILLYLKVQGLYDRDKIIGILDEIEKPFEAFEE